MKTNKNKQIEDILIVGSGAAGLYCALNLPVEYKVRIITKDKVENSDSFLAQGGIAALREPEDYSAYFEDTLKAGHYKNNKESVQVMIQSSKNIIMDLISYGVDFEKNEKGLVYTREGGHSSSRILHHKDITGKEITSKLLSEAKNRSNIIIEEYNTMVDIITENETCKGVVTRDRNGKLANLYAKKTVFATGGIGGLFKHSTNYSHITGDALAISINHGIKLKDLQFIQIHPTVLYSKEEGRRFLISEAVRGEGAILLNHSNERFVNELSPRDVVSSAINDELKKSGKEYVYLSVSHLGEETIKRRFPNIYERCLLEGYDLLKNPVPVTTAQHYFMGGIEVDLEGRTSMKNLYAIGETSCNGVHGQNRLGSNSLLESLVFSERAALQISRELLFWQNNNDFIEGLNVINDFEYEEKLLAEKYKKLIMQEIKRRDRKFYEKWCDDEIKCG